MVHTVANHQSVLNEQSSRTWGGAPWTRRRSRRSLVLAVPVAAAAAACGRLIGGGEQAPAAARRPGEPIALRHVPWPGIPASRAAQTAVVKDWNERHADVQIVEEDLPGTGNVYQKLRVQAAGGTLPDLAFMQGSYDYVSFVIDRLLLPIESSIKKDRAFNQAERLHPRSREIVELLGHIWALPMEAGTYVLFYNRDMLAEAGVPAPRRGWTWQDLQDRARQLTREVRGEQRSGYGQGLGFGRIEPWIAQNGTRVFDRVVFPAKQRFDAPEVIEAVRFVHELAWKHRVMATEPGAGTQGVGLWEGRHAMRQEGIWMMPDLAQRMQAPWGMAPLPRGKQEATWMSIDVNVAFQTTRYPQECYEFLKFINNEGQKPMIELWGRMPVTLNEQHKQTYIRYLKSLGIEDWQVPWEAWQYGYGSHLTPAWPELEREVVGPAFTRLFGPDGASASVAATLQAIAPQVQQILTASGQPPRS